MWMFVGRVKRGAKRAMHIQPSDSQSNSPDAAIEQQAKSSSRRDTMADNGLTKAANPKQFESHFGTPIVGTRRGSSRDVFDLDNSVPPLVLPARKHTFLKTAEDLLTASPTSAGMFAKSPVSPKLPQQLDNLVLGNDFDWSADIKMICVESPTALKEFSVIPEVPKNKFDDEVAANDQADDGTEKQIVVRPRELALPVKIGGNSRAGWSTVPGANGCEDGLRKQNQDSYVAHAPFCESSKELFVSVFDGHGAEGRKVSQFVRNTLPAETVEKYRSRKAERLAAMIGNGGEIEIYDAELRKAALKYAFMQAETRLKDPSTGIDHQFSGTTGVGVWLVGQLAYAACTGDSRAIIGRKPGSTQAPRSPRGWYTPPEINAIALTYDQKPTRPDEKKRVRAAGGRITRWKKNVGPLRVWLPDEWIPGLAMTRSIGDTILTEFGVTPEPEVTITALGPLDSFMVLASDGVWEFMSSSEVAFFVWKEKNSGTSPSVAASRLVNEAARHYGDCFVS
jgi:serine/threonine protein phosphatase PrpC